MSAIKKKRKSTALHTPNSRRHLFCCECQVLVRATARRVGIRLRSWVNNAWVLAASCTIGCARRAKVQWGLHEDNTPQAPSVCVNFRKTRGRSASGDSRRSRRSRRARRSISRRRSPRDRHHRRRRSRRDPSGERIYPLQQEQHQKKQQKVMKVIQKFLKHVLKGEGQLSQLDHRRARCRQRV